MKLKKLAALTAALVMLSAAAFSAYAEQEPPPEIDDSSAVVTEAPESSPDSAAETSSETETETSKETVTETSKETEKETTAEITKATTVETTAETTKETTVITTEEKTIDPSMEPSKIALRVGEIVDRSFDVELTVMPETRITGATLKVEYDSTVITLMSSKINKDAIGGMPVEKKSDGVYTFTYLNTEGPKYSGTYSTLSFKLADDSVASSVIYVSVEKLEDMDLLEVPNIIQNGIVRIKEDESTSDPETESTPAKDDEIPVIKTKLDPLPVTLEDLGVPDVLNVKAVKLLDSQLAYYEKGAVFLLQTGETELVVKYINGNELHFRLIITDDGSQESKAASAESKSEGESDTTARNLCIAAAVMFAIAAIALEYIFIIKPFRKKKSKKEEAPEEEDFEAYDDDDETELVQDPEEVFAKRNRPAEPQREERSERPRNGNRPSSGRNRNDRRPPKKR